MKKSVFAVLAGSFLALSAASASADIGVNLKAGTLGAGVEVSKGLSNKLSISVGLNAYNYQTSDTTSDVDYDAELQLQTAGLLANYHPFGGMLRLTGGVLYNKNELSLTGKPSGNNTYTINDVTYSASAVGNVSGKLAFAKTAPYVGIGLGNSPSGKFGLSADIGALYQGSPELSLSATGAAGDPTLAADLEAERQSAESDLGDYKWYPVLALGMYYRF